MSIIEGLSSESLDEARRIHREGGPELEAVCADIEHGLPALYALPFQLERDLRAQGMNSREARAHAVEAGILAIALRTSIETTRLSSWLAKPSDFK